MIKPSLLLMLFLSTSCALTNIHIKGPYKATSAKTVSAKAVYIDVDHKPSKRVGVKKGGYGNETAEVYLDEAQSTWIKKALTAEFRAYGYDVLEEPKNNTPRLKVYINQLFVEPDVGFWSARMVGICDLSIQLKTVEKGTHRRNFVETDESSEMVWTDTDFINRFNGAVNLTLSDVVYKTNQFLAGKE